MISTVWSRMLVLVLASLFVLFAVLAFMPTKASAAAVFLNTATSTSNNASTTLAKVGDTVSFQIALSATPAATSSPVISVLNLGTTTMSGSGANWTYSTTSATAWPSGNVTFTVAWGGTLGEATSTFATAASTSVRHVRFDKTAPTVSTLTSNATAAGALKVGDTIVFTLTPGATEYSATVAGSYNSESLTWTTINAGVTFVATSTVTEGQTDRTTALQITDAIVTDAAGNAGTAAEGSDIAKTIDANSPAAPTASPQGGNSVGSETVTLASVGSDSIRYTTDGSTPTCSVGTVFSTGISVTSSLDIKSIGCDSAGNDSSVLTSTYTITASQSSGSGSHRSSGGGGASAPVTQTITPPSGSGLSGGQKGAILDLLRSFGADQSVIDQVTSALGAAGASASPASGVFSQDLQVGSLNDEVKALQKFLNEHGFVVSTEGPGSPGNETTFFGRMTRDALIKFQTTNGISPAAGYFGPKTRAVVSGM